MEFRYEAFYGGGPATVRIIIFIDRQPNASTPVISDLLNSTPYAVSTFQPEQR